MVYFLAIKIFSYLRKVLASLTAQLPPNSTARRLGHTQDAQGLVFREQRRINDRGVVTILEAEVCKAQADIDIKRVRQHREELEFQAQFALSQAEAAIKALIDLVLRPDALARLGGDVVVRRDYLNLPATISAQRATASARRLRKEAEERINLAILASESERIRQLTTAKLRGKSLQQKFMESLKFLQATLELEVTIEKTLDQREIETLAHASDANLAATVTDILAGSRRALIARIQDQLRQLGQRLRTLPHIELLTDAEIAATVAPYYGGLDKALKKKRARNALVAVEERAREAKYQGDVAKFNEKRAEFADVSRYYPLARTLKRELILFVGPTNSGKTWRSLNELAAAESGVYLAPLRLLALEGQEELEKRGKPTSFITGEERDLRPGARFVSSTIEMLNTDIQVDAVVVDEVQLLADERRGWAWLAAVVGAPAKKVIMTGSPDCVEMVKDLASYLGESLTIHHCQRHNQLRVAPAPMRLQEARPGMAIVCFSRRDVMRIKQVIEESSEHKVAVVYGNLSPQVRREEARRFRTGEAAILVATDAIAMGLNLPIKEVLFYKTEKFNGEEICQLTPSEIRQIGGRAGRYGFAQYGVVNALSGEALTLIKEAIDGSSDMLPAGYFVAPGRNHIQIISEVLQTSSLERILTFFDRAIEFSDERFFRSNIDDLSFLSTFVDQCLPDMDIQERLTIACAPVPIRSEKILGWFLNRLLPQFNGEGDGEDDLLDGWSRFEAGTAKSQSELQDAEDYLKILTIYAWLAYRYPAVFTKIEICEERREVVNAFIERSLRAAPETALAPLTMNKMWRRKQKQRRSRKR